MHRPGGRLGGIELTPKQVKLGRFPHNPCSAFRMEMPPFLRFLLPGVLSAMVFAAGTQSAYSATVAIIDTGLDPGVVGGSLAGPGYDFFNNDAEAVDDEPGQHGTSAGVSAIQEAPNIRLLPVKAFGSDFETSSAILAQAFEYTAQQGVRAASHSIGSIVSTPLSALQALTNSGAILVVQAGNAGAAAPTGDARQVPNLGGRGIVAGGLSGDELWVASNRAGDLADYYVVADVHAPINGWVGTSMATPRVAAIAAAVGEAHPFLSPGQVVQIIFESAEDLGAPGVDAVYGHGRADFGAAMAAVGEGSIPSGGDEGGGGGGGGGGAGLALAAVAVGGAVAYSIYNKKDDLKKTIFVDKFGRGFNIDLAARASVRGNTPVFGLFNARHKPVSLMPLDETGQSLAFVSEPVEYDLMRPGTLSMDDPVDETRYIGFRQQLNHGPLNTTMALNADIAGEFGALAFDDDSSERPRARFINDRVFSTPVLGYSSRGSSVRFAWDGGQELSTHRLGLAVIDDQEEYGQESNSVLYENNMEREDYRLGFQLGALLEDGSLLGGASDGAFSADETNTYYIGVNGAWDLSEDVTLMGGYFQGMSKVKASANSLLDQFSEIRTEGYGLGLLVDSVFSPRDSFGIAWSSPMQTTGGSARLTLPVSQNRYTGDIGFERTTLSFEGADREKIVETYYSYNIGSRGDIFAHFSYTENPVTDPELSRDRTLYLGWRREF